MVYCRGNGKCKAGTTMADRLALTTRKNHKFWVIFRNLPKPLYYNLGSSPIFSIQLRRPEVEWQILSIFSKIMGSHLWRNFLNPFIFIKNKHLVTSSEGFSALGKKAVLRWHCCPSSHVWQPVANSNGSLVNFFLNLNMMSRVWQLAAEVMSGALQILKKCNKQPLISAAGSHTRPHHSAE